MLTEIKGDIFESKSGALAHCVSRDLHMGKGIAAIFKERFGQVESLLSQKKTVGKVACVTSEKRSVYYLVTKERYYQKPSYETLKLALVALANQMQAKKETILCKSNCF